MSIHHKIWIQAARSPALELLHEAVRHSLPELSPSERVSLVKVCRIHKHKHV